MKIKKSEEPVAQVMTAEETEALEKDNNVSMASTDKLNLAIEFLAHMFNIDDSFHIIAVKDAGKTMTLGFANKDYEVTVKIKDTEEVGIIPTQY